jgi:ElaB/YqjD/DUF883 family membrane-anchored ribosome-binding protein
MPTRDPTEIRSEIEKTREEIAQSLSALRTSVTEATDWRTYVRRQPLVFVGSAFAVGFLIGMR